MKITKSQSKIISLILSVILVFIYTFFVKSPSSNYIKGVIDVSKSYPISKVVDGDTIEINVQGEKKTIRLIGIDTPEVVDPRKPVQCFGNEASKKTKSLLGTSRVKLELDSSQDIEDKYGRLLAYVYREDDNLFVNEYLIKNGFAFEYTYDKPYKYQSTFKADELSAKDSRVGLWNPSVCNY